MSNDSSLWEEWEGRVVPRSFSVGFVVLSYVVSYVGAWTTLELFNQRTAGRGLYNWSLLVGSSVSMGGIAIWCMHYIGNRAIVLGDGQDALQIAYNPGFTALSFFIPTLVLLVAFIAMGSKDRVSIYRVVPGGSLAGSTICGMHYLGQAGISNYTCVYHVKNVAGSAVIAVVASVVALSVFFVLRATWTNSWWKRALCAIILAGAVSGMHWLASVGTEYRFKHISPTISKGDISRDSTVIVVIVLSIAACFILLIFTMLAQRRRSRSANRAQQVVVACAVFDNHGRIMVTPEGLLPNRKVTTANVERSLDGIFGTSHSVFQWIFRATRNWASVNKQLPNMRKHASAPTGIGEASTSEVNLKNDESESIEDYSIVFRELFCIAAAELADELGQPLANVGVLFDEIYNTGHTAGSKYKAPWSIVKSPVNLEGGGSGTASPGRGLLLFLVRVADRSTVEQLSASGYRFTEVQNVANIITRRMQINCDDLKSRLTNMYEYAGETNSLRPGVHLTCFAVRASIGSGFDVLVCKNERSKLPTISMPFDFLDEWKTTYISQFDNWTVSACLKFLHTKSSDSASTEEERNFATQLLESITVLRDEVKHPLFADALFISKPIILPCAREGRVDGSGQVTLIAFRLMLPIQFRAPGQNYEFIPLSFFKLQQYEYKNGADQARFARVIHKEFGRFLNSERLSIETDQRSPRSPTFLGRAIGGFKTRRFTNSRTTSSDSIQKSRMNSDSSSERKLVQAQSFGGIMVSQEVSVDVKEFGYGGPGNDSNDGFDGVESVEMRYMEMGTSGKASKDVEDPETYVDALFSRCIENR